MGEGKQDTYDQLSLCYGAPAGYSAVPRMQTLAGDLSIQFFFYSFWLLLMTFSPCHLMASSANGFPVSLT